MITAQEEAYVLEKAYVPEHIVSLIESFLTENHLGFAKDTWLIRAGYPTFK